MVAKGRGGRGRGWEFRVSRCKLLHVGWINSKVLVYSKRNYIQYPVIKHNRKKNFFLKTVLKKNKKCFLLSRDLVPVLGFASQHSPLSSERRTLIPVI